MVFIALLTPAVVQATVLEDIFGVTLTLDTANPRYDDYRGYNTYPFVQSSFIPNPVNRGNYIVDDWYGEWSPTSVTNHDEDEFGQWPAGSEPYDVEALYAHNDTENLYIAIITSYDLPPGHYESRGSYDN